MKELLLSKNVPHSLVEPLLKIHRSVQTNPQQRIQDVTEIIAELRFVYIPTQCGNFIISLSNRFHVIFFYFRDPMKDDDNVQAMEDDQEDTPEENMDETEYEEVRVVSKAEKDKMVEGQQKKKIEIAKIKVKLNILRDDLDKAVTSKDFVSAQDLQLEIGEYNSQKIFIIFFFMYFYKEM